MSTQNRYATLPSDRMGKGAEPPPALPSRRRTPERLTARAPLPSAAPEATAAAPVAPTAGDVFYDKGAATAANFRPSYWSYERNAANELGTEPPAVVGMPIEPPATTASLRPAVADELAATIEHVLGSRYAGGRPVPDSAPKPRPAPTAGTPHPPMGERRQSPGTPTAATGPPTPRPTPPR